MATKKDKPDMESKGIGTLNRVIVILGILLENRFV